MTGDYRAPGISAEEMEVLNGIRAELKAVRGGERVNRWLIAAVAVLVVVVAVVGYLLYKADVRVAADRAAAAATAQQEHDLCVSDNVILARDAAFWRRIAPLIADRRQSTGDILSARRPIDAPRDCGNLAPHHR